MRKTLKINQTSYYNIHNEVPKWHSFLVMYVQNRTPYPTVSLLIFNCLYGNTVATADELSNNDEEEEVHVKIYQKEIKQNVAKQKVRS